MPITTEVAPAKSEVSPATLKSYVFQALRTAIVSGRYKPGQRLNESQLAREFQISRIPIREALMQLSEHGLVMNHPRRGMFVTVLSEDDIQQINSVRLVREAEALTLCSARMTRTVAAHMTGLVEQMDNWGPGRDIDAAAIDLEFHRTVWHTANNPYLAKALDNLTTVLFAHTALETVNNHLKAWQLQHHRTLLNVVLGDSPLSAHDAMLQHLQIHFKNPERFSSFSSAPDR